jgi:hypothetical protein
MTTVVQDLEINKLILAKVHTTLPSDVSIDQNREGRWEWHFRCVSSEDFDESEDGFDSALDATFDFINFLLKEADETLELLYKNEEGDNLDLVEED